MSLRVRLNLLIAALQLMFMCAVGVFIINGNKASIQEGVEAATRVTVQLLDTVILSSDLNPQWGYTHDVMRRFLEHLGHVRSSDIYLYDLQGDQLYKSPPSKYQSDVVPPQWFVAMLAPPEKTVSRKIRFGTLIIVPNPSGAIRESWGKMTNLFWIGLGFFVLLNVLVYWMLGRSIKPLNAVLRAINQVEQGDFSTRLPSFNLPEFARIAQNFNSMGESLQASTAENRRLALIAQQTADAMMIHDLNGNITYWNPAAQRIFGYTPEEMIGQSAGMLAPPNQADDLSQNLRVITSGQSIKDHDTQRLTKDGRLIDVSISAAPLIDPQTTQIIGDICSMRDITERKHAEAAEKELEENRQLTHLIQRHIEDERRSLARELHDELGQYVTAIKTFAVGIANKTKSQMPDVEANAQTIVAAANHIYDGMHNIIRQLRPGSLDNLGLSETLRDSVAEWRVQNPQITIALNLSGELDALGETLNINLYRIVQESVTNALRHSQASALDIKLAITKTGELQLVIKDNGKGMDINTVDQTNHFGLLGMRERAQALRGSFNLDSAPKQGTTIYINIPKGNYL